MRLTPAGIKHRIHSKIFLICTVIGLHALLFPASILSQTHVLLKNIGPGADDGLYFRPNFTVWNDYGYFGAYGSGSSERLYRTDGTSANTIPIVQDNQYTFMGRMIALSKGIVFEAYDESNGIYFTNGTPQSEVLLKDLQEHYVVYIVALHDSAALMITEGFNKDSTSLWVTDGSPEGTIHLGHFTFKSDFIVSSRYQNSVIFSEKSTSGLKFQPVITDGTIEGSKLVIDFINEQIQGELQSVETAVGTSSFIFTTGTSGDRVFRDSVLSNASIAGDATYGFRIGSRHLVFASFGVAVYDSIAGQFTALPTSLNFFSEPLVYSDKIYFHNDNDYVFETDGTSAGTRQISSETIGSSNFDPYLFAYDSIVYYSATIPEGLSVRAIDLVSGNDSLFAVIRPNGLLFNPVMFGINSLVVYMKTTASTGREFWVYDPTIISASHSLPYLPYNIVVAPNPALDACTVHVQHQDNEMKKINLVSSTGEILNQYSINDDAITVPLTDFPAGFYFIQIVTHIGVSRPVSVLKL